jgi:hypothetical protein
METDSPVIAQTNARLWAAVLSVRLQGRNPATMCEVRDALNARRRQRAPIPESALARWRNEHDRQMRTWGKIEEPHIFI